MRSTSAFVLAGVLACACLPASADTRLGLGYVHTQYDYDDIGDGGGLRLIAGTDLGESRWAMELEYVDAGGADIEGSGGTSFEYRGALAKLLYHSPAGVRSRSRFLVGGGLYHGDTNLAGSGIEPFDYIGATTTGLALTLGFEWMGDSNVGVRFDLTNLFGVEDFTEDNDVLMLGIALVVGSQPAVAPRADQ